MGRHWNTVVKPLLVALMARVLVEVGTDVGVTTKRMLEWGAVHGAVVHGIDPAPRPGMDLDALTRQYGDAFVFHRALSLEALPKIRDPDFVLLDGDHNWYTVHAELRALDQVAREESRPYPVTVLHDVGWPYGRRDMYYNPETIPAEHRHEYAKSGLVPGVKKPVGPGRGINAGLANALVEGTPRNGVRTAVEDFLTETDRKLEWATVPAFNGVGILADEDLIDRTPALREQLDRFGSPEFLSEQCRMLEMSRLNTVVKLRDAERELRAIRKAATAPEADRPAR